MTKPAKPPLSQRLKDLLAEYGSIALVVYLVLFGLVFAGFAIAIAAGIGSESASGLAGTAAAAWVATKLTQPFRIAGTLALTPLAAALMHRYRGRPLLDGDPDDDPDDEEEE